MTAAVSSSLDLSAIPKRQGEVLVVAQDGELIMVWDGQRHLANVTVGEPEAFQRHKGQWRIAPNSIEDQR